jgi:RNA-directed DNA polymerase
MDKLRDTIRQKTRRKNPLPMKMIIEDVNRTLRGWFEYFQHSIANIFPEEDGWIRHRLRSILRRRHKGRGRGCGIDHQRWPNAYFAEHGLISLALARKDASRAR